MLYYVVTTAILAFLLFFPVSRLILVVSVRRLERKTRTKLSERELAGQRTRARFIAIIAVVPFAALFNYTLIGAPG
ncbi:MAG: hypothetical protein ACE5H8_10700 [Alphaproteobacteria bacterium]